MTILRPIEKCQVNLSLFSEDGELDYPGSFITSSGITYLHGRYQPITLSSSYDPVLFEPLIRYCIKISERKIKWGQKKFTIAHDLKNIGGGAWERPGIPSFVISKCTLVGFNVVESDRCDGEISIFSLTFKPGKVTPRDECEPYREPRHLVNNVIPLHKNR